MNTKKKTILFYTIPFLIVQAIVLYWLIKAMKFDYIRDVIATTAFYLILITLEMKYKLNISNSIRGLIIISIISHTLLGEYIGLYATAPIYDRFQHIMGTFTFALFSYTIINQTLGMPLRLKLREAIFIFTIGITLGTFVEIVEFIIDMTTDPKIHYQLNQMDTDLDLVSDVVGSILAGIYIFLAKRNVNRKN